MTLPAEGLDLAPEPGHVPDSSAGSLLEEEGEGTTTTAIQGRSLRQIAWRRLKQDKVALGGGVVVCIFVFVAIFAKPLCALYGQTPNTAHQDLLNQDTQMPIGPFSGASTTHWLGIAPVTGYDILANLIYGARTSLIIASLATLLSLLFGVSLGLLGGYFRGSLDLGVTWLMDLLLSFPVLLFSIALLSVFAIIPSFLGLSGAPLRFAVIIFVLGFFGFPYIGRIVRGQVLSLREKEFVDAARSLGASNYRIMSREVIPNVLGPILVYTTLTIPNYMLGEAGLSYLGVGVPPGTPSWGQMLSDAGQYFQVDPWYLFVPGMTIFITVLAFNLFGDGLRDALDPRSTR
jgi:peptide/nickel transport system permease protein